MTPISYRLWIPASLTSALAIVAVLEVCTRKSAHQVVERIAMSRQDGGTSAGPPAIVLEPAAPPRPAAVLPLEHEDQTSDVDHLELAGSAMVADNAPAALEQYRMHLAHTPDEPTALWGVARTGDAEDERLAPMALEKLALVSPSDPRPVVALARRAFARGDIDDAASIAERAALRDPDSAEAHNVHGRVFLARGKIAAAIAAFQKATELDPGHTFAQNNLGLALIRAGKFGDAVAPLEAAVSLEPVEAYMWNNLGIAYEKSGRPDDARVAYERALSMDPSYVKARVNLARAEMAFDIARAADAASE